MEEYKLTLGMEPTDDYKKAKQDLIQAMRSIQKIIPSTAANVGRGVIWSSKCYGFESNTTPVSEVNIKYVRVYKR